ncbi:MAG: hypothetical protein K9I74_14970 [Bacteroidales bacterium]|nr:hypothetical protein [Bacteroidales bacterium]
MKINTVFGLVLILSMIVGCMKTKTCNLEIKEEEKSWFPYDSTDQRTFINPEDSSILELTFTRLYLLSDDEVTKGNQCRADAVNYIEITDSTGNTSLIGQYRLFKKENSDGNIIKTTITFGNLDFYQTDYRDSTLHLSQNKNSLQKLDTLTIGDSTYHHAHTLAPTDTTLFTQNQFLNIYFSRNFEVLKFILWDAEQKQVYELMPPD